MYRVWGRASSSNVQALLWGMEEMGLSYERVDVGEAYGGLDTPDFRAMTPHGLIPVLELPEGLRDYYAQLCARPAYQKTVMVSYEALKNTFGE